MKKWQKLGLGLLTMAAVTSLAACGNASSKGGGDDFLYVFNGKEKSLTHSKVVEEYGKENNIKVKTILYLLEQPMVMKSKRQNLASKNTTDYLLIRYPH